MSGKECWCDPNYQLCQNGEPYHYTEKCNYCRRYLKHLEERKMIQCAACGHTAEEDKFFNSAVHEKFKICPVCGTVRFVCNENRGYRKAIESCSPAIFG